MAIYKYQPNRDNEIRGYHRNFSQVNTYLGKPCNTEAPVNIWSNKGGSSKQSKIGEIYQN